MNDFFRRTKIESIFIPSHVTAFRNGNGITETNLQIVYRFNKVI